MEADACGHIYMHPQQRLAATIEAMNSITPEDVNQVMAFIIFVFISLLCNVDRC